MKWISFLLFSFSAFSLDVIRGTLLEENGGYAIKTLDKKYQIYTSKTIEKSLPSLAGGSLVKQANGKPYAFEFQGKIKNKIFVLNRVPTNIPGSVKKIGIVGFDDVNNEYFLDGKKFKFGYTKVLNGYEFDKISRDSFLGQKVIAEGDYDKNGVFVVQALTPFFLFQATPSSNDEHIQKIIKEKDPLYFVKKVMSIDKNIRGDVSSFRTTLYKKNNELVKSGDYALIVTLSGRQGDSFGSINGHFVAGFAEVLDDLSLRGEVSNAYVTNGKDILSGNTSLTNYYSNLVQGQNVYRPTFSLIVYGVNKEKLLKFRNSLEASHIEFRTKKLEITEKFNCTTETVKALKEAGIIGKYFQFDNEINKILAYPFSFFGDLGKSIHFGVSNDASRFQPRPSFESFAKGFLDEKQLTKNKIKRVDYVFYNQIPSNRPVGGAALGEPFKSLKFRDLYNKYEVNEETKLGPSELRPILEEILPETSGVDNIKEIDIIQ